MNVVAVPAARLQPAWIPVVVEAGRAIRCALAPEHSSPLHAHVHVFRVGDVLRNFYVVRSGSFKCYTIDSHGREYVTSFRLPGESLGLNAISTGRYPNAAVALETSTVWIYPYPELQQGAAGSSELRARMLERLSQELSEVAALSCDSTAEERVAHFLTDWSKRLRQRGLSATRFNLSMSRREIANHLGLATETVTRVFTHYHAQTLIEIDRRAVHLLDLARLQRMCATTETEADMRPS